MIRSLTLSSPEQLQVQANGLLNPPPVNFKVSSFSTMVGLEAKAF